MSISTKWLAVTAVAAGRAVGGGAALLGQSSGLDRGVKTASVNALPAEPVAADNTPDFPALKTGDYELVDQHGNLRRSASPDGRPQLVFFGYGHCKAVCSLALPNMAEATNLLDGMGIAATPVMITVDPKRDTPADLKITMAQHHERMIGLTGDEKSLEAAYKAFNVKKEFLFTHPEEGEIFSHSSFIFLLDGDGKFQTMFPPVTNPARMAQVAAVYIRAKSQVGS